MKQSLLQLLLLCSLVVPASALPKATFSQKVLEFDEVAEGEAVEHAFPIANTGDTVLEIRKIVPSCGCTAAVVASDEIKPGDSTDLKVRFDTVGFRGYKVKTVRVYTNDPDNSSVVLTMKGRVRPPVDIDPANVNFGKVVRGTSPTKELDIRAGTNKVAITALRSRSEFIKAEKVASSRGTKIRVTLDPEAPIGVFRSRIALRTDSAQAPLINIPVYAQVRGDLELSKSAVSFGLVQGPLDKAIYKTVKLENKSVNKVLILSAQSDHPNVSVEVKPLEAGKEYQLTIGLSGNVYGAVRARISITTDHEDPAQQKVILPVYGILSRPSEQS